ncbi:SH2 domain containing 2A [Turdus rufiventris]|nr:SH2 domain containing 2A [Turdus rufiventris]
MPSGARSQDADRRDKDTFAGLDVLVLVSRVLSSPQPSLSHDCRCHLDVTPRPPCHLPVTSPHHMKVQGGLPGEDQDDEPELGEHKVKVMLTQVVGERRACGQCLGAPRLPSALQEVPPGPWSPPAAQPLPEEEPWPERVALRAQTRLWFEQTQAQRLGPKGELPVWFHGFISRREAEELLQDQPLGCFLVRFSESTVGFVLSYRGRDRCRHFVLDQLPDGRYVILGERGGHAELAGLLQHHATAPVSPYHEFLSVPLPCAWVPPSLPAKSGWRGSRSPSGSAAAPEPPAYAQVHKEGARPELPEAKYQQLMCFHVYAEPREEIAASPAEPIPAEPIPFYAMARGWGPRAGPEENIYSEVALSRQEVPARQPVAPQNAFSTLPPKPRPHRRLFRSVSSQDCKRRQLSAAASTDRKDGGASSTGTKVTQNPALELDDPVYGQSTPREQQTTAMAENVYEQLPGDCP